jgi:putative restriction endonuclease
MPQHFWVNQGQSFEEARRAKCLWAPERDATGDTLNHWDTMNDLEPGDVVFTYSDMKLRGYAVVRSKAVNSQRPYRSDNPYQPGQGGRLSICEFNELPAGSVAIQTVLADHALKAELGRGQNAVLTSKGTVAQKYLCPLSEIAASRLRVLAGMSLAIRATKKITVLKPTQALALVNARVGQGLFRDELLKCFTSQCAITGLSVAKLIRASHIRPWCECESDEQKLDPHNGLLLAVGIDAAFDCGFITFEDNGALVLSSNLAVADLVHLGIPANGGLRIDHLSQARRAYLKYHREQVFEQKRKRSRKQGANGLPHPLGPVESLSTAAA